MFGISIIQTKKLKAERERKEKEIQSLKWCIDSMFHLNYEEIDLISFSLEMKPRDKTTADIRQAVEAVI